MAIQPKFKTSLLESVEVFKASTDTFQSSYKEVQVHVQLLHACDVHCVCLVWPNGVWVTPS